MSSKGSPSVYGSLWGGWGLCDVSILEDNRVEV